jgi:hypothetical protein
LTGAPNDFPTLVRITPNDVGASGPTFISGGGQGAQVTAVGALGSGPNMQPSDFLGGAAGLTGAAGATSGFEPDAQRSNIQGGVSLDDSHAPKSTDSLFKPNS